MKIEEIFDALSFHHIMVLDHAQLHGIISKNDLLLLYADSAARGVIPDRNQISVCESLFAHLPEVPYHRPWIEVYNSH
jgi:hypothetical protein